MNTSLDQFRENLGRAQALCGLADSLTAITTVAVDVTDIYRAALVLGVSALDHFVHEFVRIGMLEVHCGNRTATDAHLSFKVPLAATRIAINNATQHDWLDEAVREAHSWVSFQTPDKISEAIRLVSGVRLWEAVAREIGSDTKAVKVRVTAIIDRRNKIAHEADIDPTNPGHRWPIDGVLVNDALSYINNIVHAIYKCAV